MDFVVETFTIFDGFLDNFGLRHENFWTAIKVCNLVWMLNLKFKSWIDSNKGMAFYRPTKHNSLFFISSNKSKKFQATKLDQEKDGEEVTRLEEADHLIQVTFLKIFFIFLKNREDWKCLQYLMANADFWLVLCTLNRTRGWLLDDCDCLTTAWWLPGDCLTTAWRLLESKTTSWNGKP